MQTLRLALAVMCVLALWACASSDRVPAGMGVMGAPRPATGFVFDSVTVGGNERGFAVYVPRGYSAEKKWPVIVFLNGSGECGTDGQKQLAVGLGPAIMFGAAEWPFIVVFPQKPTQGSDWLEHDALVLAALDKTMGAYATDAERVYLTGLSQGGRGTWEIAARHPRRFAAIAPICGWADAEKLAPALKDVPVWAFHGEKDSVVPPQGTKDMIAALEAAGGKPKMTLYPEANHNSWDNAYRRERLGEWLLQQRRGS